MDFLSIMWKPILACMILALMHGYLGLHVLKRGIIFVDLSLAQIAALGSVAALLAGFKLHSPEAYGISLAAAAGGAVLLSLTRTREKELPQEALIGMIYVVAAALAVLLLHRAPEGDEHIRQMLVGNILLVETGEILKMLLIYGAVGVFHFVFRRQFFEVSGFGESSNRTPSRKWDLLFYLSFGLVVTSSVEIAGVLLVFSFLIIPAAAAVLLAGSVRGRLLTGWFAGSALALTGIAFSYFRDLPTGPAIICIFGAGFLLSLLLSRAVRR